MSRFPVHTALSIASLGILLAAVPRVIHAVKGPELSHLTAIVDFSPERTPLLPLVAHPPEIPEPVVHPHLNKAPALLDDSEGALDAFYAALWRTEKKESGAVTRVVHYGDSPTTADLITGDIRAMLQQHFGDAGQGFILPAKPWAWYQHRDTSVSGSGWQTLPASHFEKSDGLFGLGGVSFTGSAAAKSRIEWKDPGQSSFELYFLQQPNGGTVTITSGEQSVARIHTEGDAKAPAFAPFTVADGAKSLDLQPDGSVRLFGLTAEKPGPGVVYDSLGLNGASITVLTHMFNEKHWAAELQHRRPNLVVINYGTNEADFGSFVDKQLEKELREAIHRVRTALPDASILVMSPMDRGRRNGPDGIETMDTIPRIVAIERRVAHDTGCGFFDTFAAMGGAGTMARWYTGKPRLVSADLIHPYPAGGKLIAGIFVREIEAGFVRYKARKL